MYVETYIGTNEGIIFKRPLFNNPVSNICKNFKNDVDRFNGQSFKYNCKVDKKKRSRVRANDYSRCSDLSG